MKPFLLKPPLTRRWTQFPLVLKRYPNQTSAHAEMDLRSSSRCCVPITNLRSRGDGPILASAICASAGKPPLTRRWTRFFVFHRAVGKQTSAHAEMDLSVRINQHERATNLRSRGDGPIRVTPTWRPAGKPPLTRRWTRDGKGLQQLPDQTSAHAEMDLGARRPWTSVWANLRSRGDGPTLICAPPPHSAKPPLTRRWTPSPGRRDIVTNQTSAHAEMDPLRGYRPCGSSSNLRSRGDGPPPLIFLWLRSIKPPLTRRWTACSRQ